MNWLRADLKEWTKQLADASPKDRARIQQTLQHWQRDPDLAGLRDGLALARRPEAEQGACLKLWADVDALLQRARPN